MLLTTILFGMFTGKEREADALSKHRISEFQNDSTITFGPTSFEGAWGLPSSF
jgi:hypothetical protein